MTLDQAALRGRIGAYRLHATHDPKETTKKACETFLASAEKRRKGAKGGAG